MGRTSTKENKCIYQLAREDAGMTRAEASEALKFISLTADTLKLWMEKKLS